MNWTIELQERLSRSDEYRHLIVHGVHPGFVGTNIWRNPTIHALAWPLPQILTWIINLLAITPQQGSVGLLDAALNPAKGLSPAQIAAGPAPGVSALVGGKFYNRCRAATPRPETRDPLARARLFQRTFEDLKVKQRGLCAEIRAPAPGLQ